MKVTITPTLQVSLERVAKRLSFMTIVGLAKKREEHKEEILKFLQLPTNEHIAGGNLKLYDTFTRKLNIVLKHNFKVNPKHKGTSSDSPKTLKCASIYDQGE